MNADMALNWIIETPLILRDLTGVAVLLRLLLATLVGGLIGWERGRHGRAAGLRTHIMVCLGACLASMLGMYTSTVLGMDGDPNRVAAQVISGIGFLGVDKRPLFLVIHGQDDGLRRNGDRIEKRGGGRIHGVNHPFFLKINSLLKI